MAVGGAAVGGTAVGTTSWVGGIDVLVGSAITPVVDVGRDGVCVLVNGGLPLAGNLQDVAVNASVTRITQVKMILFFMLFSLAIFSYHPMHS
jgi:hypothetical protein